MRDERLAEEEEKAEAEEADNCWLEILAKILWGLPGASSLARKCTGPGKGPQNGMFYGQQV